MPRSEPLLGMCYLSQSICELAHIRGHASLRKVIGNEKLAKYGTPLSTATILSRQKWHTPPDQTLKNIFFTLTTPPTPGPTLPTFKFRCPELEQLSTLFRLKNTSTWSRKQAPSPIACLEGSPPRFIKDSIYAFECLAMPPACSVLG